MKKIKTKCIKNIIKPIEKPEHYILGLDCSSSVLGWGLIDPDTKELIAYGYSNLASSKYDILQRLNYLYEMIELMCEEFSPKVVVIEEIVKFMKGLSSAATIISLTAFNRTAALSAYRCLSDVSFMNVNTIRKIIKNKNGLKNKLTKEDMPDVIKKHLYNDLKYYKKRTTGWTDQTYDQADGIATAWAFCLQMDENEKTIK